MDAPARSENTQLPFEFKMIAGKRMTADFSGGEVTSDAGVLVWREIAGRTGIIDHWADAITDRRHPKSVRHDLKTLYTNGFSRYEDANDAHIFRLDPVFKAVVNQLPSEDDPASQPTISRFENALTVRDIYRIAESHANRVMRKLKLSACPKTPLRMRYRKRTTKTVSSIHAKNHLTDIE